MGATTAEVMSFFRARSRSPCLRMKMCRHEPMMGDATSSVKAIMIARLEVDFCARLSRADRRRVTVLKC